MNYILQYLQGFTVQILSRDKHAVLGTGFVVASTRELVKILTAAHVIRDIVGKHARQSIGASVFVNFPLVPTADDRIQEARVTRCFEKYDDDVVMLQLVGNDPRPIAYQNSARLGNANKSLNNRFISYGFPYGRNYPEGVTDGLILDLQKSPYRGNFIADWTKIKTEKSSMKIVGGMSGAAVLDKWRNLVVGMIIGFWASKQTSDENFASSINCKVLTFEPFNLALESHTLELESGPGFRFEIDMDKLVYRQDPGKALFGAPESPPHWAGRESIIKLLDQDWSNIHCHITGLIGFGGEGKSSIARHWLDKLLSDPKKLQPKGVFWWNFYNNRNVDEFLAAAIAFLTQTKYAPNMSPSIRELIVVNILTRGRYLFVLDGFEVMQYQAGNQFGRVESKILRDFLLVFSAKESSSLCLITSRVQLLDLLNYTSYHEIRVDQLDNVEGRTLLRNLGVDGPVIRLDSIVRRWNGHALSLTLVGKYLVETNSHVGLDDALWPETEEDRYQKIHRILGRYDEYMRHEERIFLQLFSTFRSAVSDKDFIKIFRRSGMSYANPIAGMKRDEFLKMIERLISRGLIRASNYISETSRKTHKQAHQNINSLEAHPLIREYYYDQLSTDIKTEVNLHLAKYAHRQYQPRKRKNLETIRPLIDEVYYLCEAKYYDKAYQLYDTLIDFIPGPTNAPDEGDWGFLVYKLGAYETELNMLRQFFYGGNLSLDPALTSLAERVDILVSIGLDLSFLGEPQLAIEINKRTGRLAIRCGEWKHATWAYQNIADDYAKIGNLKRGIPFCRKVIKLAENTKKIKLEEQSGGYIRLAWIYFLLGNILEAEDNFRKAEALRPADDPDPIPWTWSYGEGVWYASYLVRTAQFEKAYKVSRANLSVSISENEQDSIAGCLRSLGDIHRYQKRFLTAIKYYSKAIKIASTNGLGEEIVLNYLGRGIAYQATHDLSASQADLEQALDASISFGYRLWEFDVRIALAGLDFERYSVRPSVLSDVAGDLLKVLSEARKHGYKWAERDALELLSEIALQQNNDKLAGELVAQARRIRNKIGEPKLLEALRVIQPS